jgi:hypothetical protein
MAGDSATRHTDTITKARRYRIFVDLSLRNDRTWRPTPTRAHAQALIAIAHILGGGAAPQVEGRVYAAHDRRSAGRASYCTARIPDAYARAIAERLRSTQI